MKTTNVNVQMLILCNDVKNYLDINEYQRENYGEKSQIKY